MMIIIIVSTVCITGGWWHHIKNVWKLLHNYYFLLYLSYTVYSSIDDADGNTMLLCY